MRPEMMVKMKKKTPAAAATTALALGLSVMLLGACASQPRPSDRVSLSAPVEATFREKVNTELAGEMNTGACPRDKAWTKASWKKVVARANACTKAKDWPKVREMGDHLAVHAPLTPFGPYYLSLEAAARRDYPRALWMLELALKKAPKEGLFLYQLGRVHWEMGEKELALKELKQAAESNPTLTEAHYMVGRMALMRDESSEAERWIKRALANDSRHSASLLAMAEIKMKSSSWVEAERWLQEALRADPRSSKARLALTEVQKRMQAEAPKVSAREPAAKGKDAE
ncbi:MAG: tetratricopeptide repeat protein [Bdellovibrionales bacterium]